MIHIHKIMKALASVFIAHTCILVKFIKATKIYWNNTKFLRKHTSMTTSLLLWAFKTDSKESHFKICLSLRSLQGDFNLYQFLTGSAWSPMAIMLIIWFWMNSFGEYHRCHNDSDRCQWVCSVILLWKIHRSTSQWVVLLKLIKTQSELQMMALNRVRDYHYRHSHCEVGLGMSMWGSYMYKTLIILSSVTVESVTCLYKV